MNTKANQSELEPNETSNFHFSSTTNERTYKSPFKILSDCKDDPKDDNLVTFLIVLNRPVILGKSSPIKTSNNLKQTHTSLFEHLWNISSLRICADGGANRLFQASVIDKHYNNHQHHYEQMIPDLIVGDLDSISDNVCGYYKNQGSIVYKDGNQDLNDLDKAMKSIGDYKLGTGCFFHDQQHSKKYSKKHSNYKSQSHNESSPGKIRICIYGAFGGRFDQSMASIQALFKWSKHEIFETDDIVLYTEETSALLLLPNIRYTFHLERSKEGPACGLIPIGSKCDACWSEGLQWDLNERMGSTEFGGLVSTSNVIVEDCVKVECSQPVIWTTEMRGFVN